MGECRGFWTVLLEVAASLYQVLSSSLNLIAPYELGCFMVVLVFFVDRRNEHHRRGCILPRDRRG